LQGNNEHGERIGSNKDAKAVFAKAQDPKSQTKISDLQEKFNKILDVIKKNTLYQKNFGSSTSLEKEEIIINYNELRNIDYAINKIVEEKPNSIKTIKDAALKCDKLTEELKKAKSINKTLTEVENSRSNFVLRFFEAIFDFFKSLSKSDKSEYGKVNQNSHLEIISSNEVPNRSTTINSGNHSL